MATIEEKIEDVIEQLTDKTRCYAVPQYLYELDPLPLAVGFIRKATSSYIFDRKYIEALDILLETENMSWNVLLEGICSFKNFKDTNNTHGLCIVIQEYVRRIEVGGFNSESIKSIRTAIISIFEWSLEAMNDTLSFPSKSKEADGKPKELFIQPMTTAIAIISDKLCGTVIACSSKKENLMQSIEKIYETITTKGLSASAEVMADDLLNCYKNLFKRKIYTASEYNLTPFKLHNTSLRVLTSVFSCFRVLVPPSDVAAIFFTYAEILKVDNPTMIFDIIHASLLIIREEIDDSKSLKIPNNKKLDFIWHAISFFFIKTSLIIDVWVKNRYIKKSEILGTLKKVLKKFYPVFNIIDEYWKGNSFLIFLDSLKSKNLLDLDDYKKLLKERYDQMRARKVLEVLIPVDDKDAEKPIPAVWDVMMGVDKKKMNELLRKPANIDLLSMNENGHGTYFDAVIAAFCGNGNLLAYARGLAELNLVSQEEDSFKNTFKKKASKMNRFEMFEMSFLLLTRLSITWPSIPLKFLIKGKERKAPSGIGGIFYAWARRYLKRVRRQEREVQPPNPDREKSPKTQCSSSKTQSTSEGVPTDNRGESEDKEELSYEFKEMKQLPRISEELATQHLKSLMKKVPFWNVDEPSVNNIKELIYTIPPIGEQLLEMYSNKKLDETFSTPILKMVSAFKKSPVLFVCLVQWLYCQPDSVARRFIGKIIQKGLRKLVKIMKQSDDQQVAQLKIWVFVHMILDPMLSEINEKTPMASPKEVTATAFSNAIRVCPQIDRNELPDTEKLKKVWTFMEKPAWSSPHALRLLEHCNILHEHTSWSNIFVNRTLKTGCGDLVQKNFEMILGFLMLDEFDCTIRVYESLIDFWVPEKNEIPDARYEPFTAMPIVKLITNMMLLIAWIVDERKKRVKKVVTPEVKRMAPLKIGEKDTILEVTFNRFAKAIQPGVVTPKVGLIAHILKSIAASPECRAKKLLMKKGSPEMIFQLSHFYSNAIPYEAMCAYCDMSKESDMQEMIKYLGCLRRDKII